jgi:hypothetical protein
MDEILQKLLSSELLSEEAKAEISTQWTSSVEAYKATVREEVTLEVRNEIAEQWQTERDALVENVQQFIDTKVTEEMSELRSDVNRFRDLEAEYAEKLVEEKHAMAEQLSTELDELVNKIDAFFELRLTEEFQELREDLEIVKQNDFGRRMFEAFQTEFSKNFVDEESVQAQLSSALSQLEEAQSTISSLEDSQAKMLREAKLERILSTLTGKKREQMAFVLANVETARLEEAYNNFIGRVLSESSATTSDTSTAAPAQLAESATAVVTGNEPSAPAMQAAASDKYSHLRKLAGIAK